MIFLLVTVYLTIDSTLDITPSSSRPQIGLEIEKLAEKLASQHFII